VKEQEEASCLQGKADDYISNAGIDVIID